MIEKKYFTALPINTTWLDYIYYDIETVKVDELRKLQASGKHDLKALTPFNAKYISIGINLKYPKLSLPLRSRKIGNWRIYYNTEETPISYADMAQLLIDAAKALNIRGFVAHNGNRFDFLIFDRELGYKVRDIKGTHILYAGGKKPYRLIDTIKIGGAVGTLRLDDMAKTFGVKGKNLDTAQSTQEYNINDTYILCRCGEEFNKLGIEYSPTATGRKYLYKAMKENGLTCIKSILDYPLEYIGGRTETFYNYARHCNVYDANSLYPSVMAKFKYPAVSIGGWIRLLKTNTETAKAVIDNNNAQTFKGLTNLNPYTIKERFEKAYNGMQYLLFVKVKGVKENFKAFEPLILKYFPYSYKFNGNRLFRLNKSVIYQVQGYEALWLTFFDYDIVRAYVYGVSEYPFANLYEKLYEKRKRFKARKDRRQLLLKIVLNSSYGILGLRDDITTPKELSPAEVNIINKRIIFNPEMDMQQSFAGMYGTLHKGDLNVLVNNKGTYVNGKDFSPLSIPIYATQITSNARFWLQCTINLLVLSGYKVYYCDTDSVFTNAGDTIFTENGLLNKDLLGFKLEHSADNLFVFGPKTYYYTDHKTGTEQKKCKGTGNALTKEIINLSYKHPTPTVSMRHFIDIDSIPKKIPNNNFESTYNDDNLNWYTAFLPLLKHFNRIYKKDITKTLETTPERLTTPLTQP